MDEHEEYERKKKAIFDTMSKRGQERILKIGYENWEPFPMPKDPRERIFGGVSRKARQLVQEFTAHRKGIEESVVLQKELFELMRGILEDDARAKTIFELATWYQEKLKQGPLEEA